MCSAWTRWRHRCLRLAIMKSSDHECDLGASARMSPHVLLWYKCWTALCTIRSGCIRRMCSSHRSLLDRIHRMISNVFSRPASSFTVYHLGRTITSVKIYRRQIQCRNFLYHKGYECVFEDAIDFLFDFCWITHEIRLKYWFPKEIIKNVFLLIPVHCS